MNFKTKLLRPWLNLIFPPLCFVCKEPCETRWLCPECWAFCSPMDAEHRCFHCFEEVEREGSLCGLCQQHPKVPFPSAFVFEATPSSLWLISQEGILPESLAAFALIQWEKLWPLPDVVVPMPVMRSVGESLASRLEVQCAPVLRQSKGEWICEAEAIEEGKVLLFLGERRSEEGVEKAVAALYEAFPKKVYALFLLE